MYSFIYHNFCLMQRTLQELRTQKSIIPFPRGAPNLFRDMTRIQSKTVEYLMKAHCVFSPELGAEMSWCWATFEVQRQ